MSADQWLALGGVVAGLVGTGIGVWTAKSQQRHEKRAALREERSKLYPDLLEVFQKALDGTLASAANDLYPLQARVATFASDSVKRAADAFIDGSHTDREYEEVERRVRKELESAWSP